MNQRNPNRAVGYFSFEGDDAEQLRQRISDEVRRLGGRVLAFTGTEADWFGLPLAELQRQRVLDTFIANHLKKSKVAAPPQIQALISRLSRGGIQTVRDVFVLGRRGVVGAAQLTSLQQRRLDVAVTGLCPDERYLDEPTATDAAQICLRLDQVHAGAIHEYRLNPAYDVHTFRRLRLMVSDLIMSEPALPEGHVMSEGYNPTRLQAEVTRFVAEFVAARQAFPS